MVVWPEHPRGGDGGNYPAIAALDHASEPWSDRAVVAGRARHRLDELYRDDCRRTCFCQADGPIDQANRELLATGAANFSGAFFGSMPAGGGTSQTAVVRSVGGRTQKASLVTAASRGRNYAGLRAFSGSSCRKRSWRQSSLSIRPV